MINGSNGVLKKGNEREKTPHLSLEKIENKHNEEEFEILNELDFEEAMAEAKDLVKTVIEQNNTSEARKLKRRLLKMERVWKALMRWMYNVKESSEEEEDERERRRKENGLKCSEEIETVAKERTPDPFMKILLCGLPKQTPSGVVTQEIHRQIDCGSLTLYELNKTFKKFECAQKENWIVTLPWFLGRRMLEAKCVMIQSNEVVVREFIDVMQCNKCWRFGHFGDSCPRATRCRVCAGFHHHSVCTVQSLRCVNCTDAGLGEGETLHDVSSQRCPLYKRRWQQAKSTH